MEQNTNHKCPRWKIGIFLCLNINVNMETKAGNDQMLGQKQKKVKNKGERQNGK